jgi:pilus assembly protein Flp/PilA
MKTLKTIANRFHADEDGAAMIEYTILIGIISVATITAVLAVGTWVSTQWGALDTKLTP